MIQQIAYSDHGNNVNNKNCSFDSFGMVENKHKEREQSFMKITKRKEKTTSQTNIWINEEKMIIM